MADFKYVETITTSERLLSELKSQITGFSQYDYQGTETPVANTWTVFSESMDAKGNITEIILKGVMTIGSTATPLTKEFYVRLVNHAVGVGIYPGTAPSYVEHSTMSIQVLDGWDGSTSTPVFELKGHPVRYQWANEIYTPTDRNAKKPVYMYLNINNNRLALVLVADPAVNFQDYKKSFAYVGAIKPFKYNEYDIDGNLLVTAGCVVAEPTSTNIATNGEYYFGEYTSPGNNTFQMLKTKSGIEYQKHYASFITQAPPKTKAFVDPILGDTGLELEKQGFQASRWTNRYHLSPVYVIHPFEGYRGQFDGVIAVTKHNILHLDELIVDVEGKTWKQEVYRYFDCNTEQNFINLTANQQMGVAILKEVRY